MKLSPDQQVSPNATPATRAATAAPVPPVARGGKPQVTANSQRMTFLKDDRPTLHDLNLPGPRREREGRGGAHATLDVLRYLIRCPLLPALTTAVAPRAVGRPPAYPDLFWMFFCAATREFASADHLLVELSTHWTEVAKEFYFEHDISLPAKPSVAYASFNSWRTNVVIDREEQLDILLTRFTQISAPLALAVRRAEGGEKTRPLLEPKVWDVIAADGTVRNAPSAVRPIPDYDEDGNPSVTLRGSRADPAHPERARVHEPQLKVNKKAGSPEGLYNLAVTTKGTATYSRTVLAVDIGAVHEGEVPVARRVLHRTYDVLGHTLPVLVYDGAITPVDQQDLMARHGVYTVNASRARDGRSKGAGESRAESFEPTSTTTGESAHTFGRKRGLLKKTFVTPRTDIECRNGGEPHLHHLVADGGALHEVDRPVRKASTAQRIGLVAPTHVERLTDPDGLYYFRLTLTGTCVRGGTFTVTEDLHKIEVGTGSLSLRADIANIRIIPEVVDMYAEVMGHRNQVESFFSWLEKRYYRHDKAASWGREAQLFDLVGAALLHNAETWAHLAYRHPTEADRLAEELAALPAPDLSAVKKKPTEQRKKQQIEQLRDITVEGLLVSEPDHSEVAPQAT